MMFFKDLSISRKYVVRDLWPLTDSHRPSGPESISFSPRELHVKTLAVDLLIRPFFNLSGLLESVFGENSAKSFQIILHKLCREEEMCRDWNLKTV